MCMRLGRCTQNAQGEQQDVRTIAPSATCLQLSMQSSSSETPGWLAASAMRVALSSARLTQVERNAGGVAHAAVRHSRQLRSSSGLQHSDSVSVMC